VAGLVRGRALKTRLWVTTAQATREQARAAGYVQAIEAAGGEVVIDTCAVVAPMRYSVAFYRAFAGEVQSGLNPILQNGLKPVMVDVELGTYDAIPARLREAVGPRTRAFMMAHTLGNPFDLGTVQDYFDAGFLVEHLRNAVQPQHRMVDEQRIDPRQQPAARAGQVAMEDRVHAADLARREAGR